MATSSQETIQSVFITGLKNAHGVEHMALGLIDRQLDHLVSYPEVADALRRHRVESENQIARIDEILSGFDEKASTVKDVWLTMTGNMGAIAHVFAPDEILKNSFVNYAFENFEASAYKSLLTLADAGGFTSATPLLQTSLDEELRMAAWVDKHNASVTLKYVELRAAGETAGH